jgi:hypothetical protein
MTFLEKSYPLCSHYCAGAHLNCLHNDVIHISASDGQNAGVMGLTCLDVLVDMLTVFL